MFSYSDTASVQGSANLSGSKYLTKVEEREDDAGPREFTAVRENGLVTYKDPLKGSSRHHLLIQ